MTRSVRRAATLFALTAMLLRAFIPAGWMPAAAGGAPLAFCTAGGMVLLEADSSLDLDPTLDPGSPAPDDNSGLHASPCAFATAATLAGGTTAPQTVHLNFRASAPQPVSTRFIATTRPISNHPARAPPLLS